MKKIRALTESEFKVFLREPMAGAFIVLFPLLILIGSGGINGNQEVVEDMLPSNIGLTMLAASLMGITLNLAIYRENKVLKKFQTTTIPPTTILFAEFNVLYLFSIIGIIVEILFSIIIFKIQLQITFWLFLIDLTLCAIYFFTLGFLLSASIAKTKSVHAISSILFCVMMIFNVTPLENDKLPVIIKIFSNIMPLTQARYLFTYDILGKVYDYRMYSYIYILLSILIFMVIAKKNFKWE